MTDARNQGHGHVTPRPDGVKARCGGPAICPVCQREQRALAFCTQTTESEITDADMLNWLGRRCTFASDSERYLPFRVYWGLDGDIRRAISHAILKERGKRGRNE